MLVTASDGHVVAHERDIDLQFGVGEGDSHHFPGGRAVIAAGGFFPDERGAMMKVSFGQEFGSGRETAAVD